MLWEGVWAGRKEGPISAALLCLNSGFWGGAGVWGKLGLGEPWETGGAAGSGRTLRGWGSFGGLGEPWVTRGAPRAGRTLGGWGSLEDWDSRGFAGAPEAGGASGDWRSPEGLRELRGLEEPWMIGEPGGGGVGR